MIHFVESKEGENMQVNQILQLPLQLINDVSCMQEIKDVYIGDLLSVVMAHGKEGTLWLTVQKHLNVVAVAQLLDFAGIVFVQGSYPDEETIQKATELQIPLLVSSKDAFALVKDLITLGL